MKTSDSSQNRMLPLAFIPLAIAINVGIGAIVKALGLPLYIDSVGTILATFLLGWKMGAVVGVLGFGITSIFINPFAIYFCGTQIAIAYYIDFVARKAWFSNLYKTLAAGVGLGVVASIVSAPVIILVFQGATGNGAALVTSFFVQMGNQIVESVFFSGFSIEPIDKALQCALFFFIAKAIPKDLLVRFPSENSRINNFVE